MGKLFHDIPSYISDIRGSMTKYIIAPMKNG